MPSRPDFLLRSSVTPFRSRCSYSMSISTTLASMEPLRVPMMTPWSGVIPMLVSTLLPLSTAQMLVPLPMWQVTILRARRGRQSRMAVRAAT